MAIIETIVGPVSKLLDKIIPDPRARDKAKLELIKLQGDRSSTRSSAPATLATPPRGPGGR